MIHPAFCRMGGDAPSTLYLSSSCCRMDACGRVGGRVIVSGPRQTPTTSFLLSNVQSGCHKFRQFHVSLRLCPRKKLNVLPGPCKSHGIACAYKDDYCQGSHISFITHTFFDHNVTILTLDSSSSSIII